MNFIYRFLRLNSIQQFETDKSTLLITSFIITAFGTAVYGTTIGLWRGPLQAVFVAIKFPLLIFITTICNSLLNWFISLMIGANLSLIQSIKYQFISFAVAAIILCSLSPVSLFFLFNAPSLNEAAMIGNSLMTLLHVLFIALAGIIANIRLYYLLLNKISKRIARRVLFAWLLGNMFLGCQISWILRPFIGSPKLTIQFLRPKPLEGNFYIDVYKKLIALTTYKGALNNGRNAE